MLRPTVTSVASRPPRRSRLRAVITSGVAAAVIVVGGIAAWSGDARTAPEALRLSYGSPLALGNGSARVYVTLDAAGKPVSLGVAISEAAMTGLPQMPHGGGPSAAMLMLTLPQEAKATGFDHVMLDWNPVGHEPEHVYTLPHFDFHFYNISEGEQMKIMPSDPEFATKSERLPPKELWPVGAIKFPGAVPMMGAHWADPRSPEMQPPPNGKPFTRTFLYGSYDGHFIFYEPMITKAHIETVKTIPGNVITTPINVPKTFERPGYYPTQYSIAWNAASKEYRISLEKLVQQK